MILNVSCDTGNCVGFGPQHQFNDGWAALQQAQAFAPNANEQNQVYIAALAQCYVTESVEDHAQLNLAFAMQRVRLQPPIQMIWMPPPFLPRH